MKAKEMFEALGYILDIEPRFGSIISYTKYCIDGCCRIYDLVFYENGIHCEEPFMTIEFIKAINQQCKELGWLDESV